MKVYIKTILFSLLALFCVSFHTAYAEQGTDYTEPVAKTKSSPGFVSFRADLNFLPLDSFELGTGYFSLAFGKQKDQHSFALGLGSLFFDGLYGVIGDYQYDLFPTNSIRPGLELSLFLGVGIDEGITQENFPDYTFYLAGGANGGVFVKMDISSKWLVIARTGVRLKPFTIKNPHSLEDSLLAYLGIEARLWLF